MEDPTIEQLFISWKNCDLQGAHSGARLSRRTTAHRNNPRWSRDERWGGRNDRIVRNWPQPFISCPAWVRGSNLEWRGEVELGKVKWGGERWVVVGFFCLFCFFLIPKSVLSSNKIISFSTSKGCFAHYGNWVNKLCFCLHSWTFPSCFLTLSCHRGIMKEQLGSGGERWLLTHQTTEHPCWH